MQVFNVFLITTLSGTVLHSINEIIDRPESVVQLLGEGLPKVTPHAHT